MSFMCSISVFCILEEHTGFLAHCRDTIVCSAGSQQRTYNRRVHCFWNMIAYQNHLWRFLKKIRYPGLNPRDSDSVGVGQGQVPSVWFKLLDKIFLSLARVHNESNIDKCVISVFFLKLKILKDPLGLQRQHWSRWSIRSLQFWNSRLNFTDSIQIIVSKYYCH